MKGLITPLLQPPVLDLGLMPASASSDGCTRSDEDMLELAEERRRGALPALTGAVRASGLSVSREPDRAAEPARTHVDWAAADEVRRWEEGGEEPCGEEPSGAQLGGSSRDGPGGDPPRLASTPWLARFHSACTPAR